MPSESSSKTANDLSARFKQEVLDNVSRQVGIAPYPVVLVVIVICALSWQLVPSRMLFTWAVAILLIQVFRYLSIRKIAIRTDLTLDQKLLTAAVFSLLNGCVFGAVAFFFPYLDEVSRSICTMLLVGIAAGAIGTTSGDRRLFLVIVVPLLGALMLAWVLNPSPDHAWLGPAVSILLLMLGGFLYSASIDSHASLVHSIQISHELEIANERQESSNAKLVDLNQKLAHSNGELKLLNSELGSVNHRLSRSLQSEQAANQAKARFLAAASHDLRQPLTALCMYSYALTLRNLSPDIQEIVNRMDKGMRDLGDDLDALFDISKLDSGTFHIDPEIVRPADLLENVCQAFQAEAQNKGLTLSYRRDFDQTIFVDRHIFERTVRNLISNAVKYTDAGSVSVAVFAEDECCVVELIDTGIGIDASHHDHVFEEYYQVGNSERDRSKGKGLGLFIVKRLVELMNGSIALKSTLGEGTKMTLRVPVMQAPVNFEPRLPLESIDIDGARVLIVDDDAAVRSGMAMVLEGSGCVVDQAASTLDAVARFEQQRPSIVLADLRLPNGDNGVQTVDALHAIDASVPVIIISGETASDFLPQIQKRGVPMLSKPVDPKRLLVEIARRLPSDRRVG